MGAKQSEWVSIKKAIETANKKVKQYRSGEITPILTPSKKINTKVTLLPGDQYVIGGRTGVGKSIFANWLIKGFYERNPEKKIVVGYYSIEMLPWRQIIRWYSSMKKITVRDILEQQQIYDPEAVERFHELGKKLSKYDIYFYDGPINASTFKLATRSLQEKFPDAQVIVVFDHTRLAQKENERNEEAKITSLMEAGLEIKNDIESLNIFISQLNRHAEVMTNSKRQMGLREPVLSDLFGADSVAQCADHVSILHRPELYLNPQKDKYMGWTINNLIANHVVKQRDGWTGMIAMTHDLKFNTLKDRDKQPPDGKEDNQLSIPDKDTPKPVSPDFGTSDVPF